MVVAVDKIIVAGSDPENEGPVSLKLGTSVDFRAKRTPAPSDGVWPPGNPKWELVERPSPFAGALLSGQLVFERWRDTIVWINAGRITNGAWVDGPVPSESGINKVDTSDSAFLDPNPAGNDTLYDVDTPYIQVPNGFHTIEAYTNFKQRVTIKACENQVVCSNEAPWRYRARSDGDVPRVDLNDLGTEHVALPQNPFYQKR